MIKREGRINGKADPRGNMAAIVEHQKHRLTIEAVFLCGVLSLALLTWFTYVSELAPLSLIIVQVLLALDIFLCWLLQIIIYDKQTKIIK